MYFEQEYFRRMEACCDFVFVFVWCKKVNLPPIWYLFIVKNRLLVFFYIKWWKRYSVWVWAFRLDNLFDHYSIVPGTLNSRDSQLKRLPTTEQGNTVAVNNLSSIPSSRPRPRQPYNVASPIFILTLQWLECHFRIYLTPRWSTSHSASD